MTLPDPFAYPAKAQTRRHHPQGYIDYGGYKPWLRDEFVFRCVYCLERETWYPDRDASFSADHVVPKSDYPQLECDYTNLVYACTRCNSAKGENRVLDPTREAFGDHLRVHPDGSIEGLTNHGKKLIELLHLDIRPAVQVRAEYILLLQAKQKAPQNRFIDALFNRIFGYPDDLPDLTALRPPKGNANGGSAADCCHARRARGQLGQIY